MSPRKLVHEVITLSRIEGRQKISRGLLVHLRIKVTRKVQKSGILRPNFELKQVWRAWEVSRRGRREEVHSEAPKKPTMRRFTCFWKRKLRVWKKKWSKLAKLKRSLKNLASKLKICEANSESRMTFEESSRTWSISSTWKFKSTAWPLEIRITKISLCRSK